MKYLYIYFFLLTCSVNAQNMQEGFTNLEKGEFAKAEVFFEKILKEFPENKTAKLCYGRAIGLNSDSNKATAIFSDLLKIYPEDFEIQLNYAESLLWNKNYVAAKDYYQKLVVKEPESFPALLGFANTFSNLKQYKEALLYVDRALNISEKNPNAMVSKKYMRLGYANEFVQKQDYQKAIELLDENLIDFPKDKETLLNKANIYLITKEVKKAQKSYQELATNPKDSIIALNGLSLAAHIGEKEKLALSLAKKALEKSKFVDDENLQNQTKERFIQALIWNKKYKEAESHINTNRKEDTDTWVLALSATLGLYKSDFKKSIEDYQSILKKDSLSFDGNLGISNAYLANGEAVKAYKAVYQTLNVFENQKDAVGFLQKLNDNYTPKLESKLSYSYDNGSNYAITSNTNILFPVNTKWSFSLTYQNRKTKNTINNNTAISNDFKIGTQYQLHSKASFNAQIGLSHANSINNNYSQILADVFFKIKPFKLQDLEIGYKRDVQNFNADLVDQEITADNFYLNYNMGTNFKLGWFTQYFYTTQSDNNQRNLLFTSLYYTILSKPVLKTGFNYQFITFANQVPTIYFSPRKFNAYEIFLDFLKDENSIEKKGVFYNLNAAIGYQFIEENEKQSTYRIQGSFGYKFNHRFLLNIYGLKSNIASAAVSGFTYTEFGIRLKWLFLNKPSFKVN